MNWSLEAQAEGQEGRRRRGAESAPRRDEGSRATPRATGYSAALDAPSPITHHRRLLCSAQCCELTTETCTRGNAGAQRGGGGEGGRRPQVCVRVASRRDTTGTQTRDESCEKAITR